MKLRVLYSLFGDRTPGMASPVTPSNGRALSITPGARVLKTPLSDGTIWKRLKEAGFDEESIRRRDKAALIAYIAKLESEVCFSWFMKRL